MKPILTILVVNYNTSRFVELMLYALKKLTINPYLVRIVDNNSDGTDFRRLIKIVAEYANVELERRKTSQRGEWAHAEALNYLTANITTPYFAIIDADATWLRRGWDEILIKRLDERTKVIGTQAPIGSVKEADFPLVFAMLFETAAFQALKIKFDPPPPPGHGVGAKLRNAYLTAGYRGAVIEMKNTRNYKAGPFRRLICALYYLDGDYQHIFAAHFARGSTGGASKYAGQQSNRLISRVYTLPGLGRWLLRWRFTLERNAWLRICRSIIDQESNA